MRQVAHADVAESGAGTSAAGTAGAADEEGAAAATTELHAAVHALDGEEEDEEEEDEDFDANAEEVWLMCSLLCFSLHSVYFPGCIFPPFFQGTGSGGSCTEGLTQAGVHCFPQFVC